MKMSKDFFAFPSNSNSSMPNKKIQNFFLYSPKNSNCSKLQKNILFSPKKEISKILLHLSKTKIFIYLSKKSLA